MKILLAILAFLFCVSCAPHHHVVVHTPPPVTCGACYYSYHYGWLMQCSDGVKVCYVR